MLQLSQIRCLDCGVSAQVDDARPFVAYRVHDGNVVLCRRCARAEESRPFAPRDAQLATSGSEAAKEAVQGIGYDTLVVCGFAFDPHVSEEVKRYGSLTVLPVRMNPDLSMGDELLKKTGAGNLFMIFGEPDLKVRPASDGKLAVEIRGLDVYDPTTGEIRSSSTDDIACWFIDTDYDGQSFFVRHAYFLYGGKDAKEGPYEKLKKALRAEIDEGEWSKLYSATSQPFDPPKSGKIAVKVINHFGDEVLKVYSVPTNGRKK